MQGIVSPFHQVRIIDGQRMFERKFENLTIEEFDREVNKTLNTLRFWIKKPGQIDIHLDERMETMDLKTLDVKMDPGGGETILFASKEGYFLGTLPKVLVLRTYD